MFSMFKYLSPIEHVSIEIYKKLFESLVKHLLMYNLEIWFMDFYENILKGQLRANKSNSNFDLMTHQIQVFFRKGELKICKFVLGISKRSVYIAARAEISQYPLDVYIKLKVLKYMARNSNKDNNPLLLDG